MEADEFLSLDVGLKRTGIARGSTLAKMAEPLETVETEKVITRLGELVNNYGAIGIVVGLPRNLSGNDTAQTSWVRDWVNHAKRKIDLPFYWQDEALTSKIANARQKVYKKIHDIDSLAAAIILQDFLDSDEANRVLV